MRAYSPWLLPLTMLEVALAGLCLLIATSESNETSSYRAAPTCMSGTHTPCRDEPGGVVTRKYMTSRGPGVDVDVGSGISSAVLEQGGLPQWREWDAGDVIAAEIWHGRLTAVAGLKTQDNPENLDAGLYYAVAWILTGLSLVTGAVFSWLLRPAYWPTSRLRRSRRGRPPDMSPQAPLKRV